MLKRTMLSITRIGAILFLTGLLLVAVSLLITHLYARPRTYNTENVPSGRVALVLGAGLWRDGTPTPVLRDRVTTAAELYFSGKVEKLLMSGDNRFANYNEPGAMREYALSLGVPDEDIVLDYAGRRTYDSCYRARAIFQVRQAIIVTQNFHLPRAILTCNALGIQAVGVSADRRVYRRSSYLFWSLREVPASLVALAQVWITHPLPVLGEPEPIFPTGQL